MKILTYVNCIAKKSKDVRQFHHDLSVPIGRCQTSSRLVDACDLQRSTSSPLVCSPEHWEPEQNFRPLRQITATVLL